MADAAAIAFWICLGFLLYVYAGYGLLVALAGKLLRRDVHKAPVTPTLSVIIAAYNEQHVIAERLENVLASDYPAEAMQVLVASDGSTDATEAIVGRFANRGVRLLSLPRRGKIPALVEAVRHATGEVLVFTDANTSFEPTALRALACNFADPEVGGVAGHTSYRLASTCESSSRGENLYWRFDTWLKRMESRTGSVVSAHGGLYALRRRLFRPPAEGSVTDDFIISTCAVAQRRRLVFEESARASEIAVPETSLEFWRRVRLMTRGFRSVANRRELLNPFRHGFYSVVLLSHKVLRRLPPLVLPLLFASSVMLAPRGGFYLLAAVAQALFYVLAGIGYLTRRSEAGRSKLLYVPFFYCMANAAALLALYGFVRGERITLWQPQRHAAGA